MFGTKGHRLNEELKNFITDGKLDKALDSLSDNEFTLALKNRFANLEKAEIKGTLSYEESGRERSKIVSALLEYLSEDRFRGGMMGHKGAFDKFDYSGFSDNMRTAPTLPPINIHIDNKPQFTNTMLVQNTTASPVDLSAIEALLKQLTEAQKAQLKTFVETLPEPEDAGEKESTGKQILKWLNKNAEGIVGNVTASVYYDGLKALFGI